MGKFGKSARLHNSESCTIGKMECARCRKSISGEYMSVEHYCSSRGNEDDYILLYHADCVKDTKDFKRLKTQQRSRRRREALEYIKRASDIFIEVDEFTNSVTLTIEFEVSE